MALKVKYKDDHGVVQIDMSPSTASPQHSKAEDLTNPQFDTINNRFGQYDLFGGKYDDSGEPPSLFRSRYNSIEEELANTPYAFATERSLRLNSAQNLDITIQSRSNDISPSKDIEDDRYFNRNLHYDGLFGPEIDFDPKLNDSFTVTQLIHAQDRYFDLSSRQSTVIDSPGSSVVKKLRDSFEVRGVDSGRARRVDKRAEAFTVLPTEARKQGAARKTATAVPTSKRKRELSFAILTETPSTSRPTSPRSLPVDIRQERVSPFRGRGFREETSRHNTPKTSAANSRTNSPPRRRTHSLSRIDNMAQTATLPPPAHFNRPHSPRNFLKENIQEIRGLSEINREKHEAEAETKRLEEEEALLKEMGLLDKNAKLEPVKSIAGSKTNSRSNSPNKINLRSRSNSPSAILHFENISLDSKEFINPDDGMPKPVTHKSRMRSVSKSQPQSNDVSPKHSKIPKRQSSVSPHRTSVKRDISITRRPVENNLNKNQRFISNSTSSIHETIKIGSNVHDKRGLSQSTQHLRLSPSVKGKPPISPGRGPPPANKLINSKRLSPIVGTPNKSPIEDLKPSSAKMLTKVSPAVKKPAKTAGSTPAISRLNSRQTSRASASRDPSPDKRKTMTAKPGPTKPVSRVPSTKISQKPAVPSKMDPKKPMNRTNSMKSLNRTPSTKNLTEKPPLLKKGDSKKDLTEKSQSTSKINEVGVKKEPIKADKKPQKDTGNKTNEAPKKDSNEKVLKSMDSATEMDEVTKQDNETQYDKLTNDKGELVILTKKNIVSMTTAAITSQPLEVVTTVTNQLPAAFEKAREKGIFERLGSKDSLAPKDEDKDKDNTKPIKKEPLEDKEKNEEKRPPKPARSNQEKTIFTDDHIKLKPLQPPYNNPQVERVKQRIDDILKEPEVSRENILTASAKSRDLKNAFKNVADKTKTEVKEAKDGVANKLTVLKDQVVKQNEKMTAEIRSEATKIVDSIITPVEEPKDVLEKVQVIKQEVKKDMEPIVMVVTEKKNNDPMESTKINETLVKGEAEVEVQSSNVSTPGVPKMPVKKNMADGNGSDISAHSNGGFPQSTSTTPAPQPPARTKRDSKDKSPSNETHHEAEEPIKKPNICSRLMGKCKNKCSCCVKGENDADDHNGRREVPEGIAREGHSDETQERTGKTGMSKWNCCKKKEKEVEQKNDDIARAAGKATLEYENETKRKRKLRDIICCCCGNRRRVSDVSDVVPSNVADMMGSNAEVPGVVNTGCCGQKQVGVERRDSILSDRPPTSCCNNRLCTWMRGMCRRHSEHSSSRRTSLFSKNKSLSPTLPPEDTRKKLDTSLVEHTSVMRGAIPVLPIALAYFCLFCNVLVPGLGTIFSGMFCLCFGIPRFGVHDGAKHRIGSLLINLLVGCGQLFTVLFCLVGWGWSIWWGVIMLKTARKYRKLKAEAAEAEAEAAPPVTANNHTRT